MSPEGRRLWGLPGQRLMHLMMEGGVTDSDRKKLGWLLDRLRRASGIRAAREPRQLALFYPEPPVVDQPWPCAVERRRRQP